MGFRIKTMFRLCFLAVFFTAAGLAFLSAVADDASVSSGLVLHLPLDEGEGVRVRDLSGNGNHGTIVADGKRVEDILKSPEGYLMIQAAEWAEDTLRGTGHVLRFKDIGMIKVPHHDSLSLKNELTLAAWVKLDSYSPDYAVHILRKLAAGDVVSANYMLYLFGNHGGLNQTMEGGVQLYATEAGQWTTKTPRYKLDTGRWYHVAASYHKDKGGRLYIDGEMVSASAGVRGALETNKADLRITHSLGQLSDLRIYNRELSVEEVQSIVRKAVIVEYVLNEPLDAKPVEATLKGSESGFSLVSGRMTGEKAARLSDCSLVWKAETDGDYFMEFWVRHSGWNVAGREIEIAAFRVGGEDYRIFKSDGAERLVFARGNEVLGLYPVYGWREHEWMGAAAARLGWSYVNIAVKDGQARLYVDGLAVSGQPAKLGGGLEEFSLGGSGITAFSGLRIVRERLDEAEARSRYQRLNRGDDASLMRF